MWDNSSGKVKAKKLVNPKPYDRPKSILTRVKDSVTGLLPQPSWLTNWLSPQSEEPPQIVENRTTAGISETELLQPVTQTRESFIFRRPGVKQHDIQGFLGSASQQNEHTENTGLDAPSTSQEQLVSTNLNDDDTHSESTSGCSSLLPHVDHKQESKDKLEDAMERQNHNHRAESLHESLIERSGRGRKTLNLNNFSLCDNLGAISEDKPSNSNEPGTSSDSFYEKADESFGCSSSKRTSLQPSIFTSKRPRFSITSFGPTIGEARKSLLSESIVDSPFYSGRTTYGGASAYRRASLQPNVAPSPYARKRMHARPASVSSGPTASNSSGTSNVVLSSSAQRILQALEAMSTPVRDAKRIPTSSTTKSTLEDEDTSFTGFGLNRRRRPNLGPPATKLSVGTPVAVVSRPSITKPERPDNGIVSSTPISVQPSGGKIRSRVSAPVRESLKDSGRLRAEEESVPDLPAVPIPIGLSNLPSFSLLPAPSSTSTSVDLAASSQPAKKLLDGAKAEIKALVPSTPSQRPPFTFSAPIIAVSPSSASSAIASKPLNFNFSSPLPVKSVTLEEPVKRSSTPVKPADELKTNGSVLDVLGSGKAIEEPNKVASPSIPSTTTVQGFGDKFKPPEDSWTCSICCVVNKNDKAQCVACETPKPGKAVIKPSSSFSPASSITPNLSGFGDKFKPPEDTWTCSVCCIVNKKDKTECAACESPRPGQPKVTPNTTQSLPLVTQGFGDKFKMASNQWECGVCMVRNSADDNQCKSCEEPRPGAKTANKAPVMPSFKFGAPQTLEKKPEGSTSGQSTATSNDNKSTGATGFKFGSTLETSTAPSSGFKFGNSLAPAATADAPFKIGATSSVSASGSGFSFGAKTDDSKTSTGFSFGAKVDDSKTATGFSFGTKIDDTQKPVEVKLNQDAAATPAKQESAILFKTNKLDEGSTAVVSGFKFGADDTRKADPPAYEASPAKRSMPVAFGVEATVEDSTSTSKPSSTFSFGAPAKTDAPKKDETPAQSFPSSNAAPSFSFGATKEAPKTGFSFGKTDSAKETPSFSLTAPTSTTASKEEPVKPAGLFSFPPVTSTPSTSLSFKPTASSVAAPSIVATPASSSAPAVAATTTNSSLFSFGATPSTSAATPSTGLFSFGAAQPSTTVPAPAKTSTFSFGTSTSSSAAANPPSLSFGSAAAPAPQTAAPAAPFAFGATTTVTTTSTSTFSFGSTPTPVTSSSSTATFSFGAAAAATAPATSSTASSTFSFGAVVSTPATSSTTPSTFSFGSAAVPSTSTPSFSFGADAAKPAASAPFALPTQTVAPASATSGLFSFGAQSAAAPSATATTNASSAPFSFSAVATPSSSGGAAPAFGNFGASAAKTTPFSFNSPASTSGALGSAPAFGDAASKPAGLSFGAAPAPTPAFGSVPSNGFGATSSPAPTPFSFGGQPAAGAAQPPAFSATPSFNFAASAAPALGAQPASSAPSVFQFAGATSSVNPNFNFNAPPAYPAPDQAAGPSSNLFGGNIFNATGGGPSNKRVIRKAVRRR